jgi:hypothetical protein
MNTTITVDILRETDAGIFVSDSRVKVWLPKSQIEYTGDIGDKAVEVELPVWLAEKSFLV